MKTIELQILKEDIMTTTYSDSTDCAITRALHRAGHSELHDSGENIRNRENEIVSISDNHELSDRVVKMYKYVKYPSSSISIPPEDFTFSLKLNID